MKQVLLATAIGAAMTTVAMAGDVRSNFAGTGNDVAAATRGARISTEFSGNAFPTDPPRGGFASEIAKTYPPNPCSESCPGPTEQ